MTPKHWFVWFLHFWHEFGLKWFPITFLHPVFRFLIGDDIAFSIMQYVDPDDSIMDEVCERLYG